MSHPHPPLPSSAQPNAVAEAAARIARAAATCTPTGPIRDLFDGADIAAAYAVQQAVINGQLAAGRRTVGRKIGLTNPKVQAQLGVDQPDSGVLLDDMACPLGATIAYDRLLQPKIEAEIAFVLAANLDQPGPMTAARVRDAVAYASPALEIVDSRIAGWDITIVDTVADNASCGLYVLGAQQVPLTDDFTCAQVQMTLDCDGVLVSSGSGADCLGDPLAAVAWLAEQARNLGQPLRAGEVLLSGALGPMVSVEAGSTYVARLSTLGPVSATFGPPIRSRPLAAGQKGSG